MADETTQTPETQQDNKMTMWIIGLIVAIVIIIIIIFVVRGQGGTTEDITTPAITTPTPTEIPGATEPAGAADSAIAASDQAAGSSVTVDSATLVKPGYYVIHEQKGGELGLVIGNSKLYQPGTYNDVVVTLSRPSASGETLYAMLHDDNGDGSYEFPGADLPTENKAGEVVVVSFDIE